MEWAAELVVWAVVGLIGAKWGVQMLLERLNQKHVRERGDQIPEAFREVMDEATYKKAVAYALAKGNFRQVELTVQAVALGVLLFSGLLPWGFELFRETWGESVWAMAGFLMTAGLVLDLVGWPLEWHEQFRLEERFGFNTSTARTWWMDRVKGLVLTLGLGVPLFALILKLVDWTGSYWWLWAWGVILVVQLVMMLVAPVLILPLFNRFEPLQDGGLKERLMALARRAGFQAREIQVMDGSRRSKHSNAFFTGLGRFRRIVLFDTLVDQLAEDELEAVLAHEIGHFKRKHIPKMMFGSAVSLLGGLYLVAWLAGQPWFYEAFGFSTGSGSIVPAFLLMGLLAGVVKFWVAPLLNAISRRYEYEADRYAASVIEAKEPLVRALRRLNEQNLSNLTPHPWYSRVYYSHPTLREREAALA